MRVCMNIKEWSGENYHVDNNVFIQTVTWNASLRNIDKGKTVKELKNTILESQNKSVIHL
jgi:hypothetical protein